MKRLLAVITIAMICSPCLGQDLAVDNSPANKPVPGTRADYVSDASYIIGTYAPAKSDHSPASMAAAATRFLSSLDKKQRAKISYDLKSEERREWTNLPAKPNAGGLRIGDLREAQVKAACDLMAALFSEQGYTKMINIMLADDQLLRGGRRRQGFGTEDFSIVIFGTPSASEPWAFQLDGHHIGANVSLSGKSYSMSPSFIGNQPEAYKIAGKDFRPLANETDLAYKLIDSLTDAQKKKAIISEQRAQLLTGPGADGKVPTAKGVDCSTFSDEQKTTLVSLISQWIELHPAPHADARMRQIKSEMDKMKFAWNGPTANRANVSYTIQSPTMIIEFGCQQRGENPLDHVHTMYRNPTDEYAGQLDSKK